MVERPKAGGVWRMQDGPVYLFLTDGQKKYLDFDIFTLKLPDITKIDPKETPTKKNYDLKFDLITGELIFGFKRTKDDAFSLFFPGGMTDDTENPTEEEHKRFKLSLLEFDPDNPLDEGEPEAGKGFLRLNQKGISLKAKVGDEPVTIMEKSGNMLGPVTFKPEAERAGIKSQLCIVDNTFLEATMNAKFPLPGFRSVVIDTQVSLRQEKPNEKPVVEVQLDVGKYDKS